MPRFLFCFCLGGVVFAQSQLALMLGGLPAFDRAAVRSGGGLALQANYGLGLHQWGPVLVIGEVHLLANGLRDVTSDNRLAIRDYATLYLHPGIRLAFRAGDRVAPFVAAGFGYTQYHGSEFLLTGAPNPFRPRQHTFGGNIGAGVDVRLWRFLGLRGEVRNFISPSPQFNAASTGTQNNPVVSGGFTLNWGR